jgi:hypothetical protein
MIAVSLLLRSRAEESASSATGGSEQAWMAAMSGVEEAIRVATQAVPGSIDWQDNPAVFRSRLVYEDGADRWYFTVYSPGDGDTLATVRNGMIDEAGRLNLNYLGGADLEKLPRMTSALAQSLRQFVGAPPLVKTNATAAPQAETNTFADVFTTETNQLAALDDALQTSISGNRYHGKLQTLDELLLAPGFTWSLLYGEDANLNGRLDKNEDDGDEQFPPDNHDGRLEHGFWPLLTVSSYEPDRTNAGKPKVNLNGTNAVSSEIELPPALTNYLALLRASGLHLNHPADLLDASIEVTNNPGPPLQAVSGVSKENLAVVLDLFSADDSGQRYGLVNINTAPAAVLAALPGFDGSLAETVVSSRTSVSPERRGTIAWLLTEGLVDAEHFKRIAPLVTARAFQYRFQVVGYGIPSGRFRVLQVGIDVGGSEPRITYLRDITRLGIPFPLKSGESGTSPEEVLFRPSHTAFPNFRHG